MLLEDWNTDRVSDLITSSHVETPHPSIGVETRSYQTDDAGGIAVLTEDGIQIVCLI